MANWGKEILNSVFNRLSGGGKIGRLSGDYEIFDPSSINVNDITDTPSDVFTWIDGKRYMFTDSGNQVPRGVTGMSKQDFLDMMGDLPIVTGE